MLPLELFHPIIEHLREDKAALSSLRRTDTRTNKIATSLLYHNVVLLRPKAVTSFWQATCASTRPHKNLVKSLQIGEERRGTDGRIFRNMAPKLRDILSALPNLRELSLYATFVTISICFSNLKPPFSLKRLACPCVVSGALWSFLRSQNSITTLELLGECNPDKLVHAVPKDILPRLTTISGSVDELTVFSRLRPVSNITITEFGVYFPPGDLVSTLDQVPVESITCHERDPDLTLWGRLLRATAIEKFAKSLKKWTVIDECAVRSLKNEPLPEDYLDRFSIFQALEEFRIICGDKVAPDDKPTPTTTEWLGVMANPGVWRRTIPSLRTVSIFGEDFL